MKLRPWLLSSLIGASIVGWLCLIEFYLISNSQNYFYSKHTLTSPLFYSLIAGAALALVLYPLRIVTVSKAIRKQSPHMAVGISILCFSAWYSLNHHFSLDSNTAIVASIAAYSLILLALSGNNNFAFTSFFSPSVHAPSALFLATIVAYCSIDLAPLKAKNTPNVLVVAIDSASAQHFGCYQYNRATTPNIDGLAAEGATYLNFSSPIDFELIALSSSLSDTHSTSLVSSHYSIFENQAFEQIVNTSQPSLSDRLFINSVPNFKPKTNRAQTAMAMQLIKDSNRQGEPFFMVYNLQGCKFPNDVPPHVVGHFSSPQLSDQQKLVATYDECIWHQDRLVADLIHRLDAIELREQTIVVICGSSNTTLFPNDGRLPLIVRFPRLVEAGSKVDEPINANQVTSAISKLINLANKPAT